LKKVKQFIKKYIPTAALIMYGVALFSLCLFIISLNSVSFSDYFNEKIAGFVRMILAKLTGFVRFSIAETVIFSLPLIFAGIFIYVGRYTKKEDYVRVARFLFTAFAIVSLFFSTFVFTYGVGYHGSTMDEKLGIERRNVSADELSQTAEYLADRINECTENIDFKYKSFSVMPYDFASLNDKLNDAYENISGKYPFIMDYSSTLKCVTMSEGMSYIHILGMYSYYTGESNINMDFPDYTQPFTCAHEMAHQRGVAREDEANFMAYLVCTASDDYYIRYCGYLNMYEYVMNSLYSADKDAYKLVMGNLKTEVRFELIAYSGFFDKYSESKAAKINEVVNDTYLKINGQTEGTKSYGLVVDLAVAYILDD